MVERQLAERNAPRADLVQSGLAQDWCWSSLWQRLQTTADRPTLAAWPVDAPRNWIQRVNQPETAAELASLRTGVRRGRPLGSPAWSRATAKRLGLTSTLRQRGRPGKATSPDPE